MEQIFFYKLTTDNGGAPCIENGLLSLAICKPRMRASAETGDWIFGFAANSLHRDNRLVYIARVTEKVIGGRYYDVPRFARRGDCIYERRGGRFIWRHRALHHGPSDLIHDLGESPDYPRANVLLSDDFRYFGGGGSANYKTLYPRIKKAVEELGRGHRRNHGDELRSQLLALRVQVWKEIRQKVAVKPSSAPDQKACHRTRSLGQC